MKLYHDRQYDHDRIHQMGTVIAWFTTNWVDIALILFFLYYLWEGTQKGLLLGIIDLVGFVVSFLASIKLYSFAAMLLIAQANLSRGIANAVGFLLVGFIAQLVFSFIVGLVYHRIPQEYRRAKWNTYLGFVPGVGSAIVFAAFFLTLILSLPVRGNVKASILHGKISGLFVDQTQGVERIMKQVFGEAVNDTLTFFTVSPESDERVRLNFTQHELTISPENEELMLALVNQERKANGLQPVVFDKELRDLARVHARDMFERGYFSHYNPEGESPFDRMEQAGITYTAAGENLALAPSVQLAHQGLMNSPGHRANILSPDFGSLGVGAIDGGIYGIMFVQEFTN